MQIFDMYEMPDMHKHTVYVSFTPSKGQSDRLFKQQIQCCSDKVLNGLIEAIGLTFSVKVIDSTIAVTCAHITCLNKPTWLRVEVIKVITKFLVEGKC